MGLIQMPAGMQGQAEFSTERPPLYRYSLDRRWGKRGDDRYLLWIGHNPSEANAHWNDPSVGKICRFTDAWGYCGFSLMNVMDRIGSDPSDLVDFAKAAKHVCSVGNIFRIVRAAKKAEKVVCCWGSPHASLKDYADKTETALRKAGVELHCLVLNLDGTPKHPLYVRATTPLMVFKGEPQC